MQPSPYAWTPQRIKAVEAIARGRSVAMAAKCAGVHPNTITRWKDQPEFIERVNHRREAYRAEVMSRGIAVVAHRVEELDDRWERMRAVIRARAKDPEAQKVPGGKTGLLVKTLKQIGSGENTEKVEEWAVDTGLLRELREHEKQAAQELGQWVKEPVPQATSNEIDAAELVREDAEYQPDAKPQEASDGP